MAIARSEHRHPQASMISHDHSPLDESQRPTEKIAQVPPENADVIEITLDEEEDADDSEVKITLEENEPEFIDEKFVRESNKPPLPPEDAIFQRRKGKDKQSTWKSRLPENEKDPIRSIDILKNPFLSSLEDAIPKDIEKDYHFEKILRNAGFTNAELRSISSPQEFGNLLAQIEHESAKQFFFETGYAPDDATFILHHGKYPHYREHLTLNKEGNSILAREPYNLAEHLEKIEKNDRELVKKFIDQKTAIKILNYGLSIKASREGLKK